MTVIAVLPRISLMGTRALQFEAPGGFELSVQRRIWALVEEVSGWQGVQEAVPGVTNMMIVFDHPPADPAMIEAQLLAAWERLPARHIDGRLFEIPVAYGGVLGEDLAAVAGHAGLSAREVIALHAAGEYTVCAIGSAPGFGYLHGLDPRIFMPRKAVPSLNMQAGTVIIGGMQAGISALTGPNGWNSIGFTGISMFDPAREQPSLFAVGDRLRFYAESIAL